MHLKQWALAIICIALVAGCSNPITPQVSETTVKTPGPTQSISPTEAAIGLSTSVSSGASTEVMAGTATPSGPTLIHLWVPPAFEPSNDSVAGRLLQARLAEFSKRRPGVKVDVRVKALAGQGGLLDSLTTTSAAAPQALPDLIALPQSDLETAALKGLLHPFDGLTEVLDGPDWYESARQLAKLQTSTFGIPFSGDTLVLVYNTERIPRPPTDWASALTTGLPLAFGAADPQSLFVLGQYQAEDGQLRDDQGRPYLQSDILVAVLSFYQEAEAAGVMPFWLTQLQNDDQVWDAFKEKRASMAITWFSRYLSESLEGAAAAPFFNRNGGLFTLATGWVWAMPSPDPEKHAITTQLAEFLTESEFLSLWSEALGMLPARPSALSDWKNLENQGLAGQAALSAQLSPSADILNSLGPVLSEATVLILKKESDPQTAAQEAVKKLTK